MKRLISLALMLIIPTLLTACGTVGQSSDATNLVPSNANLIAQIQVPRILEDVDFQVFVPTGSGKLRRPSKF
jgi:hypothetical protein